MKRFVALMLVCILAALSLPALAADDPLAWGSSRTSVKAALKDAFGTPQEFQIDQKYCLKYPGAVNVDGTALDMYLYFGEKAEGATYYGLTSILYVLPVENRLSSAALKEHQASFISYVRSDFGSADEATANISTWYTSEYDIQVRVGSMKDYNGSSFRTASIVYTAPTGQAKAQAAATKSAKTGTGTATDMKLTLTATCGNTNHVGNDWTQLYYVNGKRVKDGDTVSLRAGDEITVRAKVRDGEEDPDTGENEKTYTVTKTDLEDGFSVRMTVSVEENAGRYRGNKANWTVTFKFGK